MTAIGVGTMKVLGEIQTMRVQRLLGGGDQLAKMTGEEQVHSEHKLRLHVHKVLGDFQKRR